MPSTNKTPTMQLNSWVAGDKPKMSDFNNDNEKIDLVIRSHISNLSAHMYGLQNVWVAQPFITGSYAGDGTATKEISLGFRPALLFLAAQGYGPIELDTVQQNPILRFAIGTDGGGSSGLTLTAMGFSVIQAQTAPLAGMNKISLNERNITYRYFAIRPLQ